MTKNMFLYEYGDERIIVDCGLGFPEAEMFGVDFLIPDISYLKGKEMTVKAIILTHGHDDHIGGLPYILPHLPASVPVYGSPLTLGFAQDTVREFGIATRFTPLPTSPLMIGRFTVDSLPVTHSVPDARHLLIKVPNTTVYHGSDYKIDLSPVDRRYMDMQKVATWGREGVDMLLLDCLRVEKQGFTLSESTLKEVFEREIESCRGKFIITMMSSDIHRIQQAAEVIHRHGRKIIFMGRSIEENVKTAARLGYLKIPETIHKRKIGNLPADKIGLVVAGSQGQVGSSLARIAGGVDERVKVGSADKIVFSTDVIPGNENAFYSLIDQLSQQGAEVSYYDILDDLHVSGHASRGEQELMLSLIKPRQIVPIGGTFRQMVHFKNMAAGLGFRPETVWLLKDGETLEIGGSRVALGKQVSLKTIIVDGKGIGDVGKVVLSDRKKMADDGIVVVVLTVDAKERRLLAEPEIITRGFVYVRQSQEFIDSLKEEVWQVLGPERRIRDANADREKIANRLEQYIYDETERKPMILTVVIKI